MRFDIVTLFPNLVESYLDASILGRARKSEKVVFVVHDLRNFGQGKHKTVDDTPYGGGAGMVLKVDVMDACLKSIAKELDEAGIDEAKRASYLLCPQGPTFSQKTAENFQRSLQQITLICGHYEGFDERIRSLVNGEISIGEYVLTGGEIAALVVTDAIARLVPGVLSEGSAHEESWSLRDPITRERLVEYPHYTRPAEFNSLTVPEVLTTGNHAEIHKWRIDQARKRTKKRLSN